MNYLIARLTEPSTYAGIAAVAGTLSANLGGTAGFALGALATVCGALAVYLKEHTRPAAPAA